MFSKSSDAGTQTPFRRIVSPKSLRKEFPRYRALRRRVRKHRSGLQHQAKKHHSRSAYRLLRAKARKVLRFTRGLNHISKQIVQNALNSGKALVMEALTGIRERGNGFSREMRWQPGNWSFGQLASFVACKAKKAGIPVHSVDPRNTSRTCSGCGYSDKANRKTQSQFQCLQCGCSANADVNAAINIAARAVVTPPIVAYGSLW